MITCEYSFTFPPTSMKKLGTLPENKKIEIGIHEYIHTCLVRELSFDIFGR
jgi:hypothetical protein